MKFLNTKYPELFDASISVASNSTYNAIRNTSPSINGYCTKNIIDTVSTTSVYVKFEYLCNMSSDFAMLLNIRVNGGNNIRLESSPSKIRISDANGDYTETINVPSTQVTISSVSYHKRNIMLHFDTLQNMAELYSDGVLYASVTCANNGENINEMLIGALDTGNYHAYYVYFGSIIISDSIILPTESITEITPTVTSTDWTVSSGVASADNVGDTMTLTIPSGSIDETRKDVTGYGVAFLNCTPAETINAVTVAQSGTTRQVVLPSGSVETADTFAVSSASDVSALVTAAYV